jgi:syntaxin-binding protein 1
MALKNLVGQRIMNDVIRATIKAHNKGGPGKIEWRVLVVDNLSMKMVSACTKMHELSAEGITIVETVEKRREPMPAMEAIYLITPTESSVKGLLNDFQSQNRTAYKAAHVYFTEGVQLGHPRCFPILLQPKQGPRPKRRNGKDGGTNCHTLLLSWRVPQHPLQSGL